MNIVHYFENEGRPALSVESGTLTFRGLLLSYISRKESVCVAHLTVYVRVANVFCDAL